MYKLKYTRKLCALVSFCMEFFHDFRDRRGRFWKTSEILLALFAALSANRNTLQKIESLTLELFQSLNLPGKIPDNTLGFFISRTSIDEALGILVRWTKRAFRDHKFPDEPDIKLRVAAIDGKYILYLKQKTNEYCQKLKNGYRMKMLKAVLVSSVVKPVLYMLPVPGDKSEYSSFPDFLRRFVREYGQMVDMVTLDALYCRRTVTEMIVNSGLDYLIGVKTNARKLLELMKVYLDPDNERVWAKYPLEITDREVVNGKIVTRTMRLVEVNGLGRFGTIRVIIKLCRLVRNKNGQIVSRRYRYFISSCPLRRIGPKGFMTLIRLHWGIENNSNWVMNKIFGEYTNPLTSVQNGPIVTSIFRALVYNFMNVIRLRTLRKKRDCSWDELILMLFISLLTASRLESREVLKLA